MSSKNNYYYTNITFVIYQFINMLIFLHKNNTLKIARSVLCTYTCWYTYKHRCAIINCDCVLVVILNIKS